MVANAIECGLGSLPTPYLSETVRESADLRSRAERATEMLVDVLDQSAGQIEAGWDTERDSRGRTLLRLRIKDFSGEAAATFAPDEIDSEAHLGRRLYSLWGDLLQLRSRQYLAELRETVANLPEE